MKVEVFYEYYHFDVLGTINSNHTKVKTTLSSTQGLFFFCQRTLKTTKSIAKSKNIENYCFCTSYCIRILCLISMKMGGINF